MTKKRYDYIDIARGIGILLVVWAHIMVTGWTHQMIYSFHMPLFFFLSGMVFQKEKFPSFGDFLKRRAKRLLIPYVIYSFATWAIWALFRYIRHDEVESYIMPLLQTFIAQGSGAFMVHNSALWFIPCLFLTEIMYFFISRLGNIWGIMIVSLCLAGLSFLFGRLYGDCYWFLLPWNADAALIALPFYAVGNVLIKKVSHKQLMNSISANRIIYSLICLCLIIPLCWSSFSFGECSMGSSSYQCNGGIFLARAFLGIVWLVILSGLLSLLQSYKVMSNTIIRYFKWAGVNSLDIMCLHIPLKGICMIAIGIALHITVDIVGSNYIYSFAAFVMTMVASWIIIKLVRRS